MILVSSRIASLRGYSYRYKHHLILYRTNCNYANQLLLSGLLQGFYGYGDAHVMYISFIKIFLIISKTNQSGIWDGTSVCIV